MKKVFILVLAAALCGCLGDTEPTRDNSPVGVQGNQLPDSWNIPEGTSGQTNRCDGRTETKSMSFEGKQITVTVPIECKDPGIDKGDPPPDSQRNDRRSDPGGKAPMQMKVMNNDQT